jgi:DNA-directed RNA polymerase subunit RPC12/RpoP
MLNREDDGIVRVRSKDLAAQSFSKHRNSLVQDPGNSIRVAYEESSDGEHVFATFECVPCGELLESDSRSRQFVCPACGHEISMTESTIVVRRAQRELFELTRRVRRAGGFGRWDSVRFWLVQLLLGR